MRRCQRTRAPARNQALPGRDPVSSVQKRCRVYKNTFILCPKAERHSRRNSSLINPLNLGTMYQVRTSSLPGALSAVSASLDAIATVDDSPCCLRPGSCLCWEFERMARIWRSRCLAVSPKHHPLQVVLRGVLGLAIAGATSASIAGSGAMAAPATVAPRSFISHQIGTMKLRGGEDDKGGMKRVMSHQDIATEVRTYHCLQHLSCVLRVIRVLP